MKVTITAILLLSLPATASAIEYRFDYNLNGRTKRWENKVFYEKNLPGLRVNLKGFTSSSLFSSFGLERREGNRSLSLNLLVPLRENLSWVPFFSGVETEIRGRKRRETRGGVGVELNSGSIFTLFLQGGGISLGRDMGSPISGLTYGLKGEVRLPTKRKFSANLRWEREGEDLKLIPQRRSSLSFQMGVERGGLKSGATFLDSTLETNYFLGDNPDSTGGRKQWVRETRFNSRIWLSGGFRGDVSLFRSQGVTHRRGMRGRWARVVKELRDGFCFKVEHPWGSQYLLSLFYRYLKGEDDYEGGLRDERSESGELGGMISWVPSPLDSFGLEGFARVRSVEPIAQSDYDDRDEANRFLRSWVIHRINPYLSLKVKGGLEKEQQVYIRGERSANNNSVRVYSLAPETLWKMGKGLSLGQGFRLRARYQTYDWAQSQERDNLLRSLESISGIYFRLSRRLKGKLSYLHRWEDYGKLRWEDEWVERLSWKRTANQLSLSFDYQPSQGFHLKPGLIYMVEREWIPEISPLGGNQWELSAKENRLRLNLRGGISLGRRGMLLLQGSRRGIVGGESFNYFNLNVSLFY